jgi:cytoskeletal protein RodZ
MPDIGETLRETRMRRRIDMTEVEAATKIRAKYLRALENEEWDLLPGPTFVKTFLRTYAEYLGLDPRMLVEEYRSRYERPATQELTPFRSNRNRTDQPRQRRRPPRRRRRPATWLAALALIVIVGLFYLGDSLLSDHNADKNVATPSVTPLAPKATATPTPTATPATHHHHKPAAKVISLRLRPSQPVLACVEDATGKTRIDQNLDSGHATTRWRSKRFYVSFSKGTVTMIVGAKSYSAGGGSQPIGFEIRSGHKPQKLSNTRREKLCSAAA